MEIASLAITIALLGVARDTVSVLIQKAKTAEREFSFDQALIYYTEAGSALSENGKPDSAARLLVGFGERMGKIREFSISALAFSTAGAILAETDTPVAIDLFVRSGESYERVEKYEDAAYAYIEASYLLTGSGKLSEACEMLKAFAQRAESGGDTLSAGLGYASAAVKLEDMGKAEEAASLQMRAAELYEGTGDFWRAAQEYHRAGKNLDTLGRADDALKLYRMAGELYVRSNEAVGFSFAGDVYGRAAEILLRSGEKSEACRVAEDLKRVAESAEAAGEYWPAASAYRRAGDILKAAGKKKEAEALYKKSENMEKKARKAR